MLMLVFIVNLICWFIISKKDIKKTKSGELFIDNIDSNTLNLLKWRANSDVMSDLKKLSLFFKMITLLGLGLTLAFAFFKVQAGFYFCISILISLLFWIALMWGTNPKKETIEWFKYLGILLLMPWLFYVLDIINNNPAQSILHVLTYKNFYSFGFGLKSELEMATALTILLSIILLIMTICWFIINAIIISIFMSLMWLTIKASSILLNIEESTITNIAYVLSPIAMTILFIFKQ